MVDDGELPAEVVVPETTKRRRSTPPEIASTPLASAMAAHMESVILIEVTAVSPNFIQPWKMHGQRQSSGSGFIISDRRIITNHHVVKDAIDVRLRKHGVARRWRGKVVVSAHDVDLAIVTVHEEEDDTFWDGVTPAEWGVDLPTLQSSVHVVGFPMGGSTICVTQGVVSRIDCKNYRVGYTAAHNPGRILVIQIDAAINPGNSGGPAFAPDGRVVGIAPQNLALTLTTAPNPNHCP
jgi:S1-C subfamily serine protease